ncbi:MAG TPA: glycosyltransferase family 87 protein [Pyrinomonadaceae bacterium]|nr:glycosyltransferase family 87 protein [Pyrinomonadaceae bacterium]
MEQNRRPTGFLLRPALRACGVPALALTRPWKVALACGLLLAGFAFYRSLDDVTRFGGIDLRARVVASRLVRAGLNPYTFVWTEGAGERLLDPARREPGPSRFTYPPMTLALTYATAELPYRWQRAAWFVLEWAALLLSVALLARMAGSRRNRLAFLALALTLFVASSFWRLHVERGQYYVFVLLFLSLGAYLHARRPQKTWLAGVCFGLAAVLRVPFVLMLAPLWVLGFRRASAAMLVTFACVVVWATLLVGVGAWKDFSALVGEWGRVVQDAGYAERQYGPAREVPGAAEGVELSGMLRVPFANTTFAARFEGDKRHLPAPLDALDTQKVSRALAALVACAGLALAWAARRRRRVAPRHAVAFSVALVLTVEFFLPFKFDYADILLLFPLALCAPVLTGRRAGVAPAALLLLGLAAGAFLFQEPANPRDVLLGSWLRAVLPLAVFDYYLLLKLRGPRTAPRADAANVSQT